MVITPPAVIPANGGYTVEASANAGSTWNTIPSLSRDSSDTPMQVVFTGLAPSTTHLFRARATNDNQAPHNDGATYWSATTTATTSAAPTFFFVTQPVLEAYVSPQFTSQPLIELY